MSGNAGADRPLGRANPAPLTLALALLMLASATVLRAWSFTTDGLDWDESLYVVMAQRWLHGDLPYVAVWDQHPVGLPAVLALAQWLIGEGVIAARIAALLAVAATATLLARFLIRFAGEWRAGVLAGLAYLMYLSQPEGLAANTELFNNLPVTAAAFILLGEYLRPATAMRARMLFASGLLFGIGLQLKYVVFPEAAIFCSALLVRCWFGGGGARRTAWLAIVAIAAGLTPTVLATLYFWHAGALEPYLDANVRANLAYLDEPMTLGLALVRIRYGLLPLAGLLPWPIVLAWLLRDQGVRQRYGKVGLWLLLWFIAASIDVILPMKFWKHYFIALIPPLCVSAGLAIVILARHVRVRWAVSLPAIALIALPAIGLMVKHAGDSRTIGRVNVPEAIAGRIKAAGTDGRDLYVFNYDPVVYSDAGAVPPTRFVLGIELAQYAGSSGARAEDVIRGILARRPRWIVVADPSPYVYSPATWQTLDTALRGYTLAAQYHERAYVQPRITVRLFERVASSALQQMPQQPAEEAPAGEPHRYGDGQSTDRVKVARP